jgi:hypothetical protein
MIDDFHDLLAEMVRLDVKFVVVGAHALSVHGVPRATGDLDLWVRSDAANAARICEALARFGAPLADLGITPTDFTQPNMIAQLGLPPYRVDILTSISGVLFDDAWPNRVTGTIEGVQVPVLGLDAFIRNKRASGRTKDLADLEALGIAENPDA